MDEPTMEALVRRLNRMERETRRWQWIATVTLGVIGAALVLGHAPRHRVRKVLEAERFVLRDANGKGRAELGFINGASVLLLNDEDEMPGVALSVLPNGPRRVSLLDRNGKTRSILTARADGDSGLRLFDKNRVHRASLDVMADGRPVLRLAEKGVMRTPGHRRRPGQAAILQFTGTAAPSSPECAWQTTARSRWLFPQVGATWN
ncbi:MAG: hypothetical protein ACE5IQ_09005 [Candidatus Methylomirabilales bacterium]